MYRFNHFYPDYAYTYYFFICEILTIDPASHRISMNFELGSGKQMSLVILCYHPLDHLLSSVLSILGSTIVHPSYDTVT